MADLDTWDVAAANNNSAPPDGFPENMQYSAVNNGAREVMAVMARFWKDSNGELQLGGATDAYTLALNAGYLAYFQGMKFAAEVNLSNTGATTINVNAIGLQAVVGVDGAALSGGELIAGGIYEFTYDGTNFQLSGSLSTTADITIGTLNLSKTDAVDLSDSVAVLIVGPGAGAHIELHTNDIQAKATPTTVATLRLNQLGGDVQVGAAGGTGSVRLYDDSVERLATSGAGITITGATTVNGAIIVTGLVDGRDVATDGTKLDGIEALADITDTANVTAAGALMDSEVDLDIKTLLLPANTTISTFGASLIDDAAASNARTTLELGTAAVLGLAVGLENAASNITPNFDAFPEMTAVPVGTDDFVYIDAGVHKRINWNQFRAPSVNDSGGHTFLDTDVSQIRYFTGSTGSWVMPTGIGDDDCYIIVINSGSGDLTLSGSGVTLRTAAPGLVLAPDGVAVLVREISTIWFVAGTGLGA